MNKFLVTAGFTMALALPLAAPALAQGMAVQDNMTSPSAMAHDGMAPNGMANDGMKMDHKKMVKKTAMKHDAMAPQNGMQGGMTGPAPSDGMAKSSMSGPAH